MVGDSFIGRRHGIQYCEGDEDCRCYECEIKRLRKERDYAVANLTEARELLKSAGDMISHARAAALARSDHNLVAAKPHEMMIATWLSHIWSEIKP